MTLRDLIDKTAPSTVKIVWYEQIEKGTFIRGTYNYVNRPGLREEYAMVSKSDYEEIASCDPEYVKEVLSKIISLPTHIRRRKVSSPQVNKKG